MTGRLEGDDLASLYREVKRAVCMVEAFQQDVDWVDGRKWCPQTATPDNFLLEHAYVVLCSGFKNAYVERFWKRYCEAWENWEWWTHIDTERAVRDCNAIFGNKAKNRAIQQACYRMRQKGWDQVRDSLSRDGAVDALQEWPWIGPITKYHLARNLGMDVVKPDRHMMRWTEVLGWKDPTAMCYEIRSLTGDRIGTIDVVLWRWAEAFGRPSRTPVQDFLDAHPPRSGSQEAVP